MKIPGGGSGAKEGAAWSSSHMPLGFQLNGGQAFLRKRILDSLDRVEYAGGGVLCLRGIETEADF